MQIQIIDVGTPNTHAAKNGRSYQSIEVAYKGTDGKVSSKKLMSFSNPSVFKHISGLSRGDTVDVVTQKDDAGYWQWTAIGNGEQQVATQTATTPTTRVTGSNYETKEERAARQVLIVRQSSLSSAVATLTAGAKSAPIADDVIALAKLYEGYVFAPEVPSSSLDDFESDIPY
jgi:hypothetical protein